MKKYVVISGFNITDNNRGTAALSYGSISFLEEKGFLQKEQILLNFRVIKNFLRPRNKGKLVEEIEIDGSIWKRIVYNVFFLEIILFEKFNLLLPFTSFGRALRNVELIAAINGGDGFSDIYNTKTFINRLPDIMLAMKANIPVVILPQTIGPFRETSNYQMAERILRYAKKIYIRDDKFITELCKMGLSYELTKDLSFFMKPKAWNIKIENGAIGINISGLAYSNQFQSLSGQFKYYPNLIERLIEYFICQGKTVYLIPHSYNYDNPEENNDDMDACWKVYHHLKDKKNVVFINKNLVSPQIKYIISQMSFFVGTRMHANFAAIYTNVPLFGLAYSYKFQGAFEAHDIYDRTIMINNIKEQDIESIISRIGEAFIIDTVMKKV